MAATDFVVSLITFKKSTHYILSLHFAMEGGGGGEDTLLFQNI